MLFRPQTDLIAPKIYGKSDTAALVDPPMGFELWSLAVEDDAVEVENNGL
jgi:hypothetical protein